MRSSSARTALRNLKRCYKEAGKYIRRNAEYIKAILLLIKCDQLVYFYSHEREDQSGARIHDELMAASFCYANKAKYCGPTYKELSGSDEISALRQMLGLPPASNNYRGNILPSELYRERQTGGKATVLREALIKLMGIKLNSHPDTIFPNEFLHEIRQKSNINITPIKNMVVLHLRRGDVSAELYPNRYTSIDYYLNIISELSAAEPNLKFYIHSQAKGLSSQEIYTLSRVSDLILDADLCKAWADMINAEILVIAKSSFSYVPALYSRGTVIYQPFWHSKKSDWFELEVDFAQTVMDAVRSKRKPQQSDL